MYTISCSWFFFSFLNITTARSWTGPSPLTQSSKVQVLHLWSRHGGLGRSESESVLKLFIETNWRGVHKEKDSHDFTSYLSVAQFRQISSHYVESKNLSCREVHVWSKGRCHPFSNSPPKEEETQSTRGHCKPTRRDDDS